MRTWIYCRASLDPDSNELAVSRQLDDARALAKLRGWTVDRELVENDISASGKKDRPKFEQVLKGIEDGQVQALIAWDMSRLSRNRRDTVRLLEVGEKARITLAFVRGTDLDLSTPAGGLTADILAGVARNEIRVKSDRQQRANRQAAEQGRRVGGRRPFGYGPVVGVEPRLNKATGETELRDVRDYNQLVTEEAEALRGAYRDVLSGVPLGRIASQWNEQGLTTSQATFKGEPSQWTSTTLRVVLLNPRNAALRHHVDEQTRSELHPVKARLASIVGPASWPAIVPESTWRAVVDILTDPSRRSPSRSGRRLLSGVALCGVCGATVHASGSKSGKPGYRCAGSLGHVSRRAEPIDDWVSELVKRWLSRPDAAAFLIEDDQDDPGQKRAELATLRTRLNNLAVSYATDDVNDNQLRAGTQVLRRRIAELERTMVKAECGETRQPLVAVGEVWDAVDTDRQRQVVNLLMKVTILPVGRGTRAFRPESVLIELRAAGDREATQAVKGDSELVADWPMPTRQQLADVAVLMRPGIEAVRQQHSERANADGND